jgi:hypothetical protein
MLNSTTTPAMPTMPTMPTTPTTQTPSTLTPVALSEANQAAQRKLLAALAAVIEAAEELRTIHDAEAGVACECDLCTDDVFALIYNMEAGRDRIDNVTRPVTDDVMAYAQKRRDRPA